MIKVVPYPEEPGTLCFGSSSFIFRNTLQTNNKEININTKIKTFIYSHFFIESEILLIMYKKLSNMGNIRNLIACILWL